MKKLGLLVMPLMAISLLASCGNKSSTYTVTFDTNGGEPSIESQTVKEGDYAKDPQIDVTRDSQTLKFWSLQDEDDSNITKFTFSTTKITSDTTLHAIYNVEPTKYEPLTITCTEGPMTLNLYWSGSLQEESNLNIKWSKNNEAWEESDIKLQGEVEGDDKEKIPEFEIELEKDDVLYLAGDNPGGFSFYINEPLAYRTIMILNDGGEFTVSGNPLSLIKSTEYYNITKVPDGCFKGLFMDSDVASAKDLDLSCNEVGANSYGFMFYNTKLSEAPDLPATIINEYSYSKMFYGCENLISAPKILPATALTRNCYENMFCGCKALTIAPELPAPNSSFRGEITHDCYAQIFDGCSSLSYLKVGFGEDNKWPMDDSITATDHWLRDVSETGTFVWCGSTDKGELEAAGLLDGIDHIPVGWSVENPLPASN